MASEMPLLESLVLYLNLFWIEPLVFINTIINAGRPQLMTTEPKIYAIK